MTNNMKRHLLTLYTRTPLHLGSGTSVDVVDLPIMRERITGFPVIPRTSKSSVGWFANLCCKLSQHFPWVPQQSEIVNGPETFDPATPGKVL